MDDNENKEKMENAGPAEDTKKQFDAQEALNRSKELANQAAEKAGELGKQAADKAEELYNKLPLDMIGEKLGGKIDMHAKSTKIAAAAIAGVAALVVLFIFFGILGCIFSGPSLADYAPEDTNMIVYANVEAFADHPLCADLEKIMSVNRKDLEKELKKEKIELDDALSTKICFFFNVEDLLNGKMSFLGMADTAVDTETLLASAKKNFKDDESAKIDDSEIDGDAALYVEKPGENVCLIARSGSLLQFSFAEDKKAIVQEALEKEGIDLADAIDTGAIVSVAVDVERIGLTKQNKQMVKEMGADALIDGLKFVTVNVTDKGSDLGVEIVLTYEESDVAKEAEDTLETYRKMGARTVEDKDLKEFLKEEIDVDRSGDTVTISFEIDEKTVKKAAKEVM